MVQNQFKITGQTLKILQLLEKHEYGLRASTICANTNSQRKEKGEQNNQ